MLNFRLFTIGYAHTCWKDVMLQINQKSEEWQWLSKEHSKVFLVLVQVLLVGWLMEMQEYKDQVGVPYPLTTKFTKLPSLVVELDPTMVEALMGKNLKGLQVQKAACIMGTTNLCSKVRPISMKVVRTH